MAILGHQHRRVVITGLGSSARLCVLESFGSSFVISIIRQIDRSHEVGRGALKFKFREFVAGFGFMASNAPAVILAFRRFCSSASTAVSSSSKGRNKKNLVEVLQFLPNWGIGAKVKKGHWEPETYYQLTKIELGKGAKHGVAWGIFHAAGAPKTGAEEKIGGVNKRCWRYITDEQKAGSKKV